MPFSERRMRRLPFWLLVLGNNLFNLVALRVTGLVARHYPGHDRFFMMLAFSPAFYALLSLPTYIAATFRLHDTGRRGTLVWVVVAIQLLAPGISTTLAYMLPAPAPDGHTIAAYFITTGFGFVVLGLLAWLIYLCAQPSGTGADNWSGPSLDMLEPDNGAPISPTAPRAVPRALPSGGKPSFGKRGS